MSHSSGHHHSSRRPAPKASHTALPCLAVLPFRDQTLDRRESHLCEGLAEQLLHALNRAEGLRVLSRTSTFPFLDSGLPAAELGRRLGADHLLQGTLKETADGHRLSLELVTTGTGLVERTLERPLDRTDLCGLLQDLASEMADALGVPTPSVPCHTTHMDAFEAYLKGRQAYFRFNRLGMIEASGHFQKALAMDPQCALAWSGLALVAAYLFIYVERKDSHRELAEQASLKALALDDSLAEAHVSRGVALAAAGQPDAADQAFEAALQRDPDLFEAYYFYARHAFATGRPMEAIQYFEWASALRPEDYQAPLIVTQAYVCLGIHDEADASRQKGLERVEAQLARQPDDARAWYMGANALVGLRQREKGLEWARKARSLDPDDSMLLYNLACIHALADDPDEALTCLEQAVARGLTEKAWILNDGDLAPLHPHPRFQQLVQTLG